MQPVGREPFPEQHANAFFIVENENRTALENLRGGLNTIRGSRKNRRTNRMLLGPNRSEEHTSELQSHLNLVCRLLLEKKKKKAHSQKHIRQEPTLTTPHR